MLFYYLSSICKSIKVSRARSLFNTKNLSRKKRNTLLKKSGVVLDGEITIVAPFFYEFGKITVGDNAYINSGCVFLDNTTISIGADSLIGPHVTLSTVSHPISPALRNSDVITSPIKIGCNVWLGAGVVVLPGITIGDNSIIAANSVVTSNVPENTLFAGAPAIFKRNI
ncbi:DapH/DapD/GlmU-related protein [Serratia sp. J2]|uniref:DapH/DapD/GlmU-related protein n=1 Tax=Serratia sp. J2 TaxID=3386551 RepID=UPI003917316B